MIIGLEADFETQRPYKGGCLRQDYMLLTLILKSVGCLGQPYNVFIHSFIHSAPLCKSVCA